MVGARVGIVPRDRAHAVASSPRRRQLRIRQRSESARRSRRHGERSAESASNGLAGALRSGPVYLSIDTRRSRKAKDGEGHDRCWRRGAVRGRVRSRESSRVRATPPRYEPWRSRISLASRNRSRCSCANATRPWWHKQNATEYGEMGKLLTGGRVPRSGGSRASQRAGARTGRDDLAVLPRSPVQEERRHPEGDGRVRTGAAADADRRADDDVAWGGSARSGKAGCRRTAVRESSVARASLGRGALRTWTCGAGQKGLRWRRAAPRAGAGARRQRVGDPLFAGDGVPRPGRRAPSGVASAATGDAADQTRPVDEGARRVCSTAR